MRWADEALDQAIQERRARWLSAFAIQAQPLRQEILLAIDECDPAAWKQKRILRLSWAEGKTRIMKITQEAQVTPDQIEARCGFCEALRQGGVRTIRYLKTKSGYCLEDEGYLITLEADAGPALKKISLALAAKIGELTAQMHKTALAMELHLPYSTIFEPMGRNEVNALPLFSQWIQQGRLDRWTNLVRQIVREKIRAEAALDFVWDSLPHAACQGDLSLGNLGCTAEGDLIIFDYNIAGEAVLVSDMILEGLLICREYETEDQASAEACFQSYVRAYCKVRPLTEKERIAAELLYSLNSAFWFTWIAYRETSLEKALTQNAVEAVEKHLHRILAELTARNFSTFLEESERTSDNGREKRR